jgi:hypothetical protein
MAESLLKRKDYPLDYASEITNIVSLLSFQGGDATEIVGSQALVSQQYASDYDLTEKVVVQADTNAAAARKLVKRFQQMIRTLQETPNLYIGDIKAGIVPEWELLSPAARIKDGEVVGFDVAAFRTRVRAFLALDITSDEESAILHKYLRIQHPTPKQFLVMQRTLRFHIVRWTPADILRGECTLRDGSTYPLNRALLAPTVFKLDIIAYVQNSRYTDFSILYFLYNGRRALNAADTSDIIGPIQHDVAYYYLTANYFKVLKRMFSLARQYDDEEMLERLNVILNSDLGRLYSVVSDIGTLQYLLDNESHLSIKRIQYELDQFRNRLANVGTPNIPPSVLRDLVALQRLPARSARTRLETTLTEVGDKLEARLSTTSKKVATEADIFPPPARYLP